MMNLFILHTRQTPEMYVHNKVYVDTFIPINKPCACDIHVVISMLNKNSLAVKKCKANQKPQWL